MVAAFADTVGNSVEQTESIADFALELPNINACQGTALGTKATIVVTTIGK